MSSVHSLLRAAFGLADDSTGDWRVRALCAQTDPEAFYPEKGGSNREAKKVCQICPVRRQCLQDALDNDERHGVWGGLSERERRRLKDKTITRLDRTKETGPDQPSITDLPTAPAAEHQQKGTAA